MSIKGAPDFRPTQVATPQLINPFTNARNAILTDEKLAADEAYKQQMLGMQQAEHQMKVDAVAQAAKEKEAANKYADALGAATSGNVIGMPDQKALGERVALLGSQADAARLAGDTTTQNKLIAEQQSYINGVLPKMTKAYEASPEAQLQVLRGTNPLGGTADLAPQTRLALLKEAEAPIEKTLDRRLTHEDRMSELQQQHKDRLSLEALSNTNANSRLEKEYGLKSDNMSFIKVDEATGKREVVLGKDLKTRPKEEQDKFTTLDAYEKLATLDINGNKIKAVHNVGVSMDEDGNYTYTKEGEAARFMLPVDEASKLVGKGKSGGGGGGTAGGGKSKSDVLSSITTELAPKFDALGHGDGKTLIENSTAALALGVPPSIVKQLAEQASFEGSGWFSDRDASTAYYNKTGLTVITKEGEKVKLGDAIDAAKIKGVDVTAKGFTLSKSDLKKPTQAAKEADVDRSNIPAPVTQTKGLEMGPSLLEIYDKKVNELKSVPNKALARSELYPIRQAIGGDEFEKRYPGLAAELKLY